jgi:hypothetical protein
MLAQGRFKEQAEELRLYRRIATMDKSAPLSSLQDQEPTWAKASTVSQEWELIRLAEWLDALVHPKAGLCTTNRAPPCLRGPGDETLKIPRST